MMILSYNKSLDSFCEFAPRLYVVILFCRMFPWLLSVICVLRNGSGVHRVKRIVSLHCDLSCCMTRITAVRHTQFVVCMRHVQSWRRICSCFVLNYLGLLCSLSSVDSIRWSGFPVQINPVEFVSFYECLIVCMCVCMCMHVVMQTVHLIKYIYQWKSSATAVVPKQFLPRDAMHLRY